MTAETAPRPLRLWHLVLWFAAAAASTMCGIGGGLFAVPILHFLLGVPLKQATSTSLVAVFAMTTAGTVAELCSPGNAVHWPIVGLLSAGGLLGARLGQLALERISTRGLTWVFAGALLAGGARVLWAEDAPAAPAALGISLDLGLGALVLAAGFAGGFVAPLLGIGGGLIVVPAIYLGVPGAGYLCARASSTAMAAVNSAQLTWSNVRAGRTHRAVILPFALVAVLGAVTGIFLVHRPGWAEGARLSMGGLMLVIGLQYVRRAFRAPPQA
ncbi:MAG: sulfite exporter TauE/SafE family protein [Planctomycetes bacterium]|jgi:uncharacterized membrane protein YfcA|nr:sulfite exporter TauE/SafE family protein [Planctomycetota bacterium]